MSTHQFLEADARNIPLPDASVHCCITSPPYYKLRKYTSHDAEIGASGDLREYLHALAAVFRDVARVLRADGTLIVNIGDVYGKRGLLGVPWQLAQWLWADGWNVQAECIWDKPNTLPDTAQHRPERYHEHVFVFAKGPNPFWDKYRVPKEDRRSVRSVPVKGIKYKHFSAFPTALILPYVLQGTSGGGYCGTCGKPAKPNIWKYRYPTRPGRNNKVDATGLAKRDSRRHCTAVRHLGYDPACACWASTSPERPTILDPFAGTCTTAVVANWTGRNSVMLDLDPEALAIGQQRVALEKQPKPNPVVEPALPAHVPLPGQMDFPQFQQSA